MNQKKKNIFRILLYLMCILTIVIIINLIIKYVSNYSNLANKNGLPQTTTEDISESFEVITFDGYNYKLSNNCFYKINDEKEIQLYNSKEHWTAIIRLENLNGLNYTLKDYESLEKKLKDSGLDIDNRKVIDNDVISFVSFEYHSTEKNGLIAYTHAYENYEYKILLFDEDKTTMNYRALSTVIDILQTAEKKQ